MTRLIRQTVGYGSALVVGAATGLFLVGGFSTTAPSPAPAHPTVRVADTYTTHLGDTWTVRTGPVLSNPGPIPVPVSGLQTIRSMAPPPTPVAPVAPVADHAQVDTAPAPVAVPDTSTDPAPLASLPSTDTSAPAVDTATTPTVPDPAPQVVEPPAPMPAPPVACIPVPNIKKC